MHYIIYQITNLLNGMIYVGQHRTKNINDNYMGSGILILRAIQKYGKCHFKKDILFDFNTFEEMNAKEAEIVTEEFVQRDDTYNLIPGGDVDKGYALRGRKVINNGEQQKQIMLVDLPKYIAEGWELGLLESTKKKLRIKGWKWIRNIELNEQHLVLENTVQKYLALPGWELGQIPRDHGKLPQLSNRFKDYRSIFKENIEKHVPYWEVDTYLLDGWERGSLKTLNRTLFAKAMLNSKWMQKDKLYETKVWPDEILQYLEDGWTFGRIYHKRNKHYHMTEQQKQIYRDIWVGSKFMNDGTITRQIQKRDIDLYLALGWKIGGLNNKNRVIVNDGTINHSIKIEDLQKYLELGFQRGRFIADKSIFQQYRNGRIVHNIETHKNKILKEGEPLPAGYEEGIYTDDAIFEKLSKRTKGNRYILNDLTGEVSHIKQGDPLPEGWHFGRHKRKLTDKQKENIHRKCSERTWYTNGEKNAMVPWGKEKDYIDAGWKKGRSQLKRRVNKST